MKKIILNILIIGIALFFTSNVQAEKYRYTQDGNPHIRANAAGCKGGANFKWLEINNVRTRINTGGDMFWDFENAQYEIPKGSRKMSLFSSALWIGGKDKNGQLKLAAQRFRQVGVDYFPGPLVVDGASTNSVICNQYDKIHSITRKEVDEFLAWNANKDLYPNYQVPKSIKDYPAHGPSELGYAYYLAPFKDVNNNGEYNWEAGDYPYYDLNNELCHTKTPTMEGNGILVDQVLKGDGTLWWVFNDNGNTHTESVDGQPIGFEIRAQAFGFTTNDEVNNMTFYSFEIINRSSYRLTQTYFSPWIDADLGYAWDDFVGCDVGRGLGYCYNGKNEDGQNQVWAYGANPPAIGVDFFQGPYIDPDGYDNPSFKPYRQDEGPTFFGNCKIVEWDSSLRKLPLANNPSDSVETWVNAAAINGVNFGNGIVDDERFGMRRFLYHINKSGDNGDPYKAQDYYYYLTGHWKNGQKMRYGGDAYNSSGVIGPDCDFMFPGLSDECDWGTGGVTPSVKDWTEFTAGNSPDDRRFMQSAGPFVLEPGAVNYITYGIPWARATSGGPQASVELLRVVDDKCQQLFDNCFKVISGPNAPDLTIRELDRSVIIYLTNRRTPDDGNNFNESYKEYDPRIQSPSDTISWDSLYRFEGYQIFQLKDATVTVAEITDSDKARQVFQCDIENGVSRIVNYHWDANLIGTVPREEVSGEDKGISHSVRLTRDAFGGQELVNHKQYYYVAIAYAHNNYKQYNQNDPTALDGQKLRYLAGRKNIRVYSAIPHAPMGQISPKSKYGDGVVMTRIAGQGNGGNFLEIDEESVNEILSKDPVSETNLLGSDTYPIAYNLKYKQGKGPVNIKVVDPLNVKESEFSLIFDPMVEMKYPIKLNDTTALINTWRLKDIRSGVEYKSDTNTIVNNEQIFLDLGLSITISQRLTFGLYEVEYRYDKDKIDTNKIVRYSTWDVVLPNNGLLGAKITYKDSTNRYMQFVPDVDGDPNLDWIKAGLTFTDWAGRGHFFDPTGVYETSLGWTPYVFASGSNVDPVQPSIPDTDFGVDSKHTFQNTQLASVDVVFTKDVTKWTRCAILETGKNPSKTEGGAEQFEIRKAPSVNVDGKAGVVSDDPLYNSNYISETGMGWFPGYAINLETGERLNIVFGEDSELTDENGRDMMFNPTHRFRDADGKIVVGGRHYIYVMSHTQDKKKFFKITSNKFPEEVFDHPAYDACSHFYTQMTRPAITMLRRQFRAYQMGNAMWVSVPLSVENKEFLENDMKVSLRVITPYSRYFSFEQTETHNSNDYWPMYQFSTENVYTVTDNIEKAKSDLDNINVVPNPYYPLQSYETHQLEKLVKIVNLPPNCTVNIYNSAGYLVRKFSKDDASRTYINWDLTNYAGIPVAGGVYIIHVKAPHGEKIVKFFGAMSPVDLNAF